MQKSFTARIYWTDGSTEDIYDVYQITTAGRAFYFAILDGRSIKVEHEPVASISLREPGDFDV